MKEYQEAVCFAQDEKHPQIKYLKPDPETFWQNIECYNHQMNGQQEHKVEAILHLLTTHVTHLQFAVLSGVTDTRLCVMIALTDEGLPPRRSNLPHHFL